MTNTELIRQEIERLIKSTESCPFIEAEFGAEKRREGRVQAYNKILSFIDSLPKEAPQGWISVKDRLPEETGFYFTCVNFQGVPQCVGVTYFDTTRRGGEWIEDDEDNCIAVVDYWMPIPKFEEE